MLEVPKVLDVLVRGQWTASVEDDWVMVRENVPGKFTRLASGLSLYNGHRYNALNASFPMAPTIHQKDTHTWVGRGTFGSRGRMPLTPGALGDGEWLGLHEVGVGSLSL